MEKDTERESWRVRKIERDTVTEIEIEIERWKGRETAGEVVRARQSQKYTDRERERDRAWGFVCVQVFDQ